MRVFLDTNVLVYLLSGAAAKASAARDLLENPKLQRSISTQVIAEFVVTVRRKFKLELSEAREYVDLLRAACDVLPLTEDIQDAAFELAAASNAHWCDAQIVASALAAGATRLFSEDLQHGRKIGGLTIVNPFARE